MGRKRNKNPPKPGPSSRVTRDTRNDKEVKRKRTDQELQSDSTCQVSEEPSVIDGDLEQQYEPGPDWRQLPEVIENICNYLPFKDIKSVRLVCKRWSEAGTVPLSYKSVFRTDNRSSFMKVQTFFKRLDNNKLTPGFGLRNLKLDYWIIEKGRYYNAPPPSEPRVEDWLDFLKSEHVRDVVWLKLSYFPLRVLNDFLLAQSFFPKLKTLEVDSVEYSAPVEIPAEALTGSCNTLELKTIAIFDWEPGFYGLDFLKNCPKLTELKIKVFDKFRSIDVTRYRRHVEELTSVLKGNKLTSLVLEYEYDGTEENKLRIWSAFRNQLILCSSRLEILQLKLKSRCQSLSVASFDDIPVRPENLKTFECSFESKTESGAGFLPLGELLEIFESKGYLKVKNFHLSIRDAHSYSNLHLSWVNSKLSMITNILRGSTIPQSLLGTLNNLFPEINYVCSPRQDKNSKYAPLTTALFERLGRDGVFDLEAVAEAWNMNEPQESSRFRIEDLSSAGLFRLIVHDVEAINSNAIVPNRFDWKLGDESNGTLFLFDSIPDMSEAWARVKNPCSYWSSVPDDFVPAVVNDERAPAYSLCRVFNDTRGYQPQMITRSKRARVCNS